MKNTVKLLGIFVIATVVALGMISCSPPPETVVVTFHSNHGDTEANPSSMVVNVGALITAPGTNPTRANYVFDGWYKESNCLNEWNFNTDRVNNNITLYAKWNLLLPTTNITTLTADAWADGNFTSSIIEQWYKFTSTAGTQFIHFSPGTSTDVYVRVYDSAGNTVGSQTNLYGSTLSTSRTVTIGEEYYILVTPYSISDIGTFLIAFGSVITPGVDVTQLTADAWADGNFTSSIIEQWYKFTATAGTQWIHFSPGTSTQVYVQVYDAESNAVGSRSNLYGFTLTSQTVTIGEEYYVRVTPYSSSYTGTFQIIFTTFITPETGVTQLTAGIWAGGNIPLSGGVQWYKFTATAGTQWIHFSPGTSTQVYVQVYDSAGNMVGSQSTFSNSTRSMSRTVTSGAEYYVLVTPYSSYNTGTFQIRFNTTFITPGTDVTQLSAGVWADGNLPSSGSIQWYKFTATANLQFIHFSTGTSSDVYVQVYDSAGNTVGSQTRLYGSTLTSRTVTIGEEYYVLVTPLSSITTGTFQIRFNTTLITPGTDVTQLTADTWAGGNLASSGSEQWYKFTATAVRQWIHFSPGTSSDVNVQIYDSAGNTVGVSRTGFNSSTLSTSLRVTSGEEYYVRVTTYYYGTFQIAFNTTVITPGADVTQLTADTWADGNLPSSGSVQWYKFTATANLQFIHFSPGTLTDFAVQVYDSAGNMVESRQPNSPLSSSGIVTIGEEYYVLVTTFGSTGTFQIGFNTTFITPGTDVTQLTANAWADGNLASSGSVKMYKFTATAGTQFIHFYPGTSTSVNVQVYDPSGNTVGSQTRLYGSTLSTSRTVTIGEEYFVLVTPYSSSNTGTFQISFNTTFITPGAAVTQLTADTWAGGNLASSGSEQWYKFTATAGTQWIHFYPGTSTSVNVQVYDSAGNTVGSQSTLSNSARPSRTVTSGEEYYVLVTPSSSSNTGTFQISFNTTFITPGADVTQLTDDTWADGNFTSSIRVQWYKFTATADTQRIHFSPGTSTFVYVQVYDSAGNTVRSQTLLNGITLSTSRTVTSGEEYYVVVIPGSTGSFQIKFDTTFIIPGTDVTQLTDNAWADGNFTSSIIEQWYKFTATAGTQWIHFSSSVWSTLSVYVQVYDSAGNTVGSETSLYGGFTRSTSRTVTIGEEYYVLVTPYGSTGTNSFQIRFNTTFPGTAVTQLPYGWANGNFTSSVGELWYKFTTVTAGTLWIHFFPGTMQNVYVQVYDSAGNPVGSQSNIGRGSISLTVTSGGEYYVETRSPYGYPGSFWLAINSSNYMTSPQ